MKLDKSIESIWKEGFIPEDALIAPKVTNIYDRKSIHTIDKFKRMFRNNLIFIVVGGLIFLVASLIGGMPLLGISFFAIMITIVIVNRKLQKQLVNINKGDSSYQYLKTFDKWLKDQLAINRKMARIYYPLIFIVMIAGFWSTADFQHFIEEIKGNSHEFYLVFNIPILWVIPAVLITVLLYIFGGRIYNWDVCLVYGRIFRKLDEMIEDIEELKG